MTHPITHRQDISAHAGNAPVAQALNQLLADHFALYIKTKGFHWHISGPHFRDYHRMLDEQAVQILAAIDPMAERVRKAGIGTIQSIGEIARHRSIQDNHRTDLDAQEMLTVLLHDNRSLIAQLREAKVIADQAGDNATSGLIDGWTDAAEQRAWFLIETIIR